MSAPATIRRNSRRERGRRPYWTRARFPSKCRGCDAAIRAGERIYYDPEAQSCYGEACGHGAAAERSYSEREFEESNPHAICKQCGHAQHWSNRRGQKLEQIRCKKCGGELRPASLGESLEAKRRGDYPGRENPIRRRNLFGFGGGRQAKTVDQIRELQMDAADSFCRHHEYKQAQRVAKQSPKSWAREHNLQVEGVRHRVARKVKNKAATALSGWAKKLESNPDRPAGRLHYFGAYGEVPAAWYRLGERALVSLRTALLDPGFYHRESPAAAPGREHSDLDALAVAISECRRYGARIFVAHDRRGWYVAREEDPVVSNPESRFDRLEKKIARRGGAYDPYAVAAAIGIRKYGKKKFEEMAQAGRRRAERRRKEHSEHNPDSWQDTLGIPPWMHTERDRQLALEVIASLEREARAQGVRGIDFGGWRRRLRAARLIPRQNPDAGDGAAELAAAEQVFEEFHGRRPREILEVQREAVERKEFAKLGDLVSLTVRSADKKKCKIDFGPQDGAIVASSANAKQLYILGGNQDVRPLFQTLGADGTKDYVEMGPCLQIEYFTYKRFDNFQPVRYYHDFGEETGDVPVLVFDQLNMQLLLVGGAYEVKPEGIVN